jgi:superfamily II DNA or RNA helicase
MVLSLSQNNKYLIIDSCTQHEYDQLTISLTKKINGWKFHPLVKKGLWNGEVSFIKGNKIPAGLWYEIMEICNEYKFECNINNLKQIFNLNLSKEEFTKWALNFFEDHKLTPRDYQIETAYKIIRYRRCLAELATSAGKSLILFMVITYLLEVQKKKKILLIVPNISLVVQAAEDFEEYNDGSFQLKIQQIYSGKKIRPSCNVVIGTYQSLVKKEEDYFKQFDVVSIDETHKAKSASIRKILDMCWHSDYRFGVSGTIAKRGNIDYLTLMANTGPVITNISANYLQNKGHISQCKVYIVYMNYATSEEKQAFSDLYRSAEGRKKLFQLEQNYIINSQKRLNFITSIITKFKSNTLVLFYRIEHGTLLYNKLRNDYNGEVFYVDGTTDDDTREMYKKKMEIGTNKILVASYGTFSTGINIKNIHNIALTESFKSEVIIRQSIGRGLRKHETKDILKVYDFVDDLRFKRENNKVWKNYLYKHSEARIDIYKEQKFEYIKKTVKF